ncbi:hypothetical protein MRX96_043135 [Rhipicephalus microplus]
MTRVHNRTQPGSVVHARAALGLQGADSGRNVWPLQRSRRDDFYGYPPPPPRYNYATFDPTAPVSGPLQPSAPPAYRSR